ncbi:MAG: amidohydrolase family protein [Gemmatimonadota bacterium]
MRRTERIGATLAVLLAFGGPTAAPATLDAQTIAVTGGTIHTVDGPTIDGGTVLLRDGRIAAVGADVEVPEGARRIDARGRVVTPGLFDVGSRLGLTEVGAVGDTRDYFLSEDDPIRAAFDVVDGINPNSTLIPVNRLQGVTTVLTSPAGGLIAGRAAVIDLAGSSVEEMLARPRAAMVASFDAGDGGGARGGVSLRLREVLEDARFWRENRGAFDRGASRGLAASRLDLAALQPVLNGEMPLVVDVDRASDISAVLRIAGEYGLDIVVRGGAEAWMVADELAAADVPVVVNPLDNRPASFARLGARFDNAALLSEAGVRVMLTPFETHRAGDLAWEAGNAVRAGLDRDEALRAVTRTPAEVFGVGDDYGSLTAGKVANLVIWTGDPFELSSRPARVMIRGEIVPDTSRQRELFERYRTLDRDVPPAYR